MKKHFDDGYEKGYDDGLKEIKTLTNIEFSKIAYLLANDSKTTHKNCGLILYKLTNLINEETFQDDD